MEEEIQQPQQTPQIPEIPQEQSSIQQDISISPAQEKRPSKFLIIAVVIIGLFSVFALIRLVYKSRESVDDKVLSSPSSTDTITNGGIPVFPEAEGYGTLTAAGRGGRIIEVTTLADSGPGSLREALETEGPRTIVFKVGGVIDITSDNLFIKHPFVTVAGQTAPGDGITITGEGITIMTHDVLLQHLRVRPGDKGDVDPDTNDAIAIFDPRWIDARSIKEFENLKRDQVYNIVLDHISASWGEDETISVYKGVRDVTISNSIISEALNKARHSKKTHSAGLMLGDFIDRISAYRNLLAHNDFRNPLIKNNGTIDFRNNVIYDWGIEATGLENIGNLDEAMKPSTKINLIANNYIPGSSTMDWAKPIVISQENLVSQLLYTKDNVLTKTGETDKDFAPFFKFNIDNSLVQGNTIEEKIEWGKRTFFSTEPFEVPYTITTLSPREAYEKVLSESGANKPKRDYVDKRIVNEVRTETGGLIDSVDDVGGNPRFELSVWPEGYDSDHDGMPNAWEKEEGLNPNDYNDANEDKDNDGYTNIEEYLHELLK